jgi:hypothetical protein
MRKFMVIAIAGAAIGILGGSGAQADEHNPCAPQPAQKLKRCEQQDNCRVAGAAPFEDHHLSKSDRVRFYRHCVWLEERYRLERTPHGYLLDPRDHRQRKVKTRSYPLLRRAECEQAGKPSYC